MKNKYAVYCRTDKGTADLQAKAGLDYIINYHRYTHGAKVYKDEESDGNKYAFRAGLVDLLEDCKNGLIENIVMHGSLVLGLDDKANLKIISKFKEQGVHLFYRHDHVAVC